MEKLPYYQFDGKKVGVSVLMMGAVHGNEPAGTVALQKLIKQLQSNQIIVNQGSLRIIPIANPQAYKANLRYIDTDLNRVVRLTPTPQSYEEELAQELIEAMGKPDILIDFHTYTTPSRWPSMAFRDIINPLSDSILRKMPVNFILSGWQEIYKSQEGDCLGNDTLSHIIRQGSTGICVESGTHIDPHSPKLAYRIARRALANLGMVDFPEDSADIPNPIHLQMYEFHLRNEDDFLTQDYQGFDKIKPGEHIGTRANGGKIKAKEDSRIVMPCPDAKPGNEWFYLAREVPMF